MQRHSDAALVFMAKWPEPGQAKTRLSPPLTLAQAAGLARCFLLDTLDEAGTVGLDRWLAYAPAAKAADFHSLLGPDVGLIPAETANFGVALQQAQECAFRLGYRHVALVASDLPHLPARRYREAFAGLEAADVSLGPCGDGGYYLIASAQPTPHLFHGVAWSTSSVYQRTLVRAKEAGLRVSTIAPCDDVDTPSDLEPLFAALSVRPGAGRSLDLLTRLRGGLEGRGALHRGRSRSAQTVC